MDGTQMNLLDAGNKIAAKHGVNFVSKMHALLDGTIETGNYECADNYRFALADDHDMVMEYEDSKAMGCCGSYDSESEIDGIRVLFGFNYGH